MHVSNSSNTNTQSKTKYSSGKKHLPAAKTTIFEACSMFNVPDLKIYFKNDEPKSHDAKDAFPEDKNKEMNKDFRSKHWIINPHYLEPTKNKMKDSWDYFNRYVDLTKNYCSNHQIWFEAMACDLAEKKWNKSLTHRRCIVMEHWIKSHYKDFCEIKQSKPFGEELAADPSKIKKTEVMRKGERRIDLRFQNYIMVLMMAVKIKKPGAPPCIKISLNWQIIIMVEKFEESKEPDKIELFASTIKGKGIEYLPGVILEKIYEFTNKYKSQTNSYAKAEMDKLRNFIKDKKDKRFKMRMPTKPIT